MFIALILLAAVGVWWWLRADPADGAASKGATTKPSRGSPVVVVRARKADVPVYIDGLGTVTALKTVTLRSRVDGQLIRINYIEGQSVRAGETLAQIDPQPYQVQLEQAQRQLAKDQFLLDNAKLDLARYQNAREAVSQQQLDAAKSLVAQYDGTLKIDQAAIDSAKLQLSFAQITSPINARSD